MEKKVLFIVGTLLVLAIGALIVKANVRDNEVSTKPIKSVCGTSASVDSANSCDNNCNNNNCQLQCRGTCGIKNCGCS